MNVQAWKSPCNKDSSRILITLRIVVSRAIPGVLTLSDSRSWYSVLVNMVPYVLPQLKQVPFAWALTG